MSFDAKVAKNGNYYEADVDTIADERNWPNQQQQQTLPKVAESTQERILREVDESDDDAENQMI